MRPISASRTAMLLPATDCDQLEPAEKRCFEGYR
jgi:hypothetical protein